MTYFMKIDQYSVISITFSFDSIYLPLVIPLGTRRLTSGRTQLYDIVI
jgi:hypothetical protein